MAATNIPKVAPPALPQATEDYNRPYQDQLNNTQRLFYNRLTQSFNSLISPPLGDGIPGGSYLYFPYISVYDTTNQSVPVINTPTLVQINSVKTGSSSIRLVNNRIYFDVAGRYSITFNLQVLNNDTQIHELAIWLRINGNDIAWSNRVDSILGMHGGQPGYTNVSSTISGTAYPTDYIELWWSANSTQIVLTALPAITTPFVSPGAPSVAATLSFLSSV